MKTVKAFLDVKTVILLSIIAGLLATLVHMQQVRSVGVLDKVKPSQVIGIAPMADDIRNYKQ